MGTVAPNPLDAEVKRAMIRSADEAYVLTDASKFGHACLATYARLDEVALMRCRSGCTRPFRESFCGKRDSLSLGRF